MTILLKNKQTLQLDNFTFKCCIGRGGLTKFKKEGDKKTPKGTFKIENLYYRKDRVNKPETSLKCIEIISKASEKISFGEVKQLMSVRKLEIGESEYLEIINFELNAKPRKIIPHSPIIGRRVASLNSISGIHLVVICKYITSTRNTKGII